MRSEFLEREEEEYSRGGVVGLAGSLYGWSVLGMMEKFQETGEYYAPWTGPIARRMGRKGPFAWSMVGKRGGLTPLSEESEVLGVKVSRLTRAGRAVRKDPMRELFFGTKFAGRGPNRALGFAQLGASRAVGLAISTWTLSDPIYYAFNWLTKPTLGGALFGVAWFSGFNFWQKAARGLRRGQYVDLGGYFPDTQEAFTSRQRAVRAISESNLQARSAIGNEAMLFHRSGA